MGTAFYVCNYSTVNQFHMRVVEIAVLHPQTDLY
jgi:hypothetical protein